MIQTLVYTELELKLRGECERGFNVGPKSPLAIENTSTAYRPMPGISPIGEPFVELNNGKNPVANDDECYDVALATFREYAAGRTGTIYWRTYPEIERGRFYMRLLISDKPLLHPSKD